MRTRLISLLIAVFSSVLLHGQTISLLTPESGIPGQTIDVLIRGAGTNFQSNISIAGFGDGIAIQKLTVSNPLTATATINIGVNAVPGLRTVTVTTGQEIAEAPNAFEVFTASGNFKANIEVLPVETINLGDLDLTHPANAPILFFANIYNDNVQRNVRVAIELSSASKGRIGSLAQSNKAVAPNTNLRLTNRDFNEIDFNGSTGNSFLQQVRTLGTFPPDNYSYKLIVTDQAGNIIGQDESTIAVTNPISNPELILPGANFHQELDIVYNAFPLFQWFGQMDKYELNFYELEPGQTPEEVVRNLPVFRQDNIAGNSFLYPAYAEKLESGKAYAWQVKGMINTSSGVQSLPSEVFRFMYSDFKGTAGAGTVASIQIAPEEIELTAGQQYKFNAIFLDADGKPLMNITPQWQLTPNKGTITSDGLFTAGSEPATLAVIVKMGSVNEFATVTIRPQPINATHLIMNQVMRKLFGLPNQ